MRLICGNVTGGCSIVGLSALCLGTVVLAAVSTPASAINAEKFPLHTFKNFQRVQEVPDKANKIIIDAAKPGLSVVVENSGEVRGIPDEKRSFMEAFAKSAIRDASWVRLYREEIRVVEQGRSYWLPVQKAVLPKLLKQVSMNKQFTVYTRYFGTSADSGRVFVAIDFDPDVPKRLPDTSCFSDALADVQLGEQMTMVKKRLTTLYGEPFHTGLHSQRRYYIFDMDSKHRTQLIITDAGSGYREKVFVVQITGPPNPDLPLYRTLHLGSGPAEVERVLGKPVKTRSTGKGYTLLSYRHSPCSAEMKNGVLASILIMEDPNYFAE